MKFVLLIAALLTLPLPAAQETSVPFERCTSYFERNDSGLTGESSYLAFVSQAQFDRIFGPAAVMGKNSFLPKDAFAGKIVVAAVHRGNYLTSYDSIAVASQGDTLSIRYTVKKGDPGSAAFRSPLILAVAAAHFTKVVFVENGKPAGSAAVPAR